MRNRPRRMGVGTTGWGHNPIPSVYFIAPEIAAGSMIVMLSEP